MEYARYLTIVASLVGGVWIASRVFKAPKKMIFSLGQHHLGQPLIIDFLDPGDAHSHHESTFRGYRGYRVQGLQERVQGVQGAEGTGG